MPNYCDYEMKIKGSKEAITRVLECLNADYNYDKGKPLHQHFFRVFDATKDGNAKKNADGTYTQLVYGYCAWSVHSCMCAGGASYYQVVKNDYPEIFMGTTLAEQSEDCEIEVFSEEPGMCFSEHYVFKNGKCVCDEEAELDFVEKDEDTIILNPYRRGKTGQFLWHI